MRALDTGSATAGILGADTGWPGRRVRDVADKIWLLDPQNAALTTLLRNLRKKYAKDVKFEWHEDVFPAQKTISTTNDASSADPEIDVTTAEGKFGRIADLWMNSNTGEVVYIISIATDAWTVVRGVGGSTPADIATGDIFFYIGNAQQTGDTARAKLTTQTVGVYNYCQIFKEGWEITNTAATTDLYGGPDRVYLRGKHGDLHNRDIERAFWFGVRDDLDSGDASNVTTMSYTTRGVFNWIATNEETNTSELTEDEFNQYLESAFRYGNKRKFMFCSPRACTTIDGWGRDAVRVVPSDTTFGIAISRYKSSHGELNLVRNELFYDFADTNGIIDYSKCSVILDLEDLWFRYKRNTKLAMGIQENDRDSVEDEYLTECGLQMVNEKHHTEIYDWSQS